MKTDVQIFTWGFCAALTIIVLFWDAVRSRQIVRRERTRRRAAEAALKRATAERNEEKSRRAVLMMLPRQSARKLAQKSAPKPTASPRRNEPILWDYPRSHDDDEMAVCG